MTDEDKENSVMALFSGPWCMIMGKCDPALIWGGTRSRCVISGGSYIFVLRANNLMLFPHSNSNDVTPSTGYTPTPGSCSNNGWVSLPHNYPPWSLKHGCLSIFLPSCRRYLVDLKRAIL